MQFRVSPQSIIDIITNSSTEIYTFPSSEATKLVEDIVNEVLKQACSDLKFKDIFEVNLVPNGQAEEDFHYWLEQYHEDIMESDSTINYITPANWCAKNPEKSAAMYKDFLQDSEKYNGSDNLSKDLMITTKSGAPTDLANKIRNVFESQEVSN